jgi:phosphate starvation-inducible PhoH-like protein
MPACEEFGFQRADIARTVFGHRDTNLRLLETELTVDIHARGTQLRVEGDPVDIKVARQTLERLYELAKEGHAVMGPDIVRAAEMVRTSGVEAVEEVFLDEVLSFAGKTISPKTIAQKEYVDAIRDHDIVFGIGPAGTGKTYLAMAMAVAALQRRQVRRIILTRPAVEAGEKLGFLPGDLQEKVSPYLRPLYDALHDMMEPEQAMDLMERGVIEVAPLAFMRGRTLNDAFVILDEAQNTTSAQMKMFLTRLGFQSHTVITGDLTQIDLDVGKQSGLDEAIALLSHIPEIYVAKFSEVDVVRHPLVKQIISAYDEQERKSRNSGGLAPDFNSDA